MNSIGIGYYLIVLFWVSVNYCYILLKLENNTQDNLIDYGQ